MGGRVARLLTGALIEYLALDDNFVLIEMRVPKNLAGMKLGDTDLRAAYRVTVVCIKPEGQAFTYAESATILGEHDLIVVAGHRGDIGRFAHGYNACPQTPTEHRPRAHTRKGLIAVTGR